MSTTLDRVRKVIAEQLDVNEDKVTATASFVDDLGADEIDLLEVLMGLEEEFNIEITDEDFEQITTVGEAVAYIDSKING